MYNTTPITFNRVYSAPWAVESISWEVALKPNIRYIRSILSQSHSRRASPENSTEAQYTWIIQQYYIIHIRPGNNRLSAHTLRFSPEPNTQRHFGSRPNRTPNLPRTQLSLEETLRFSPESNTQRCPRGSQESPCKPAWLRETPYSTILSSLRVFGQYGSGCPARTGVPLWYWCLTPTAGTLSRRERCQHRPTITLKRRSMRDTLTFVYPTGPYYLLITLLIETG